MTSDNAEQDDRIERDELIWQLHEQGNSIRAVAAAVNLSPTQTHRVITAMAELYGAEDELDAGDDEDDDDDDEVIADTYEPVPRFVFVGLAAPEDRKGNPLRDIEGRRFPPSPRALDGRGVSVGNPELEIPRWCWHREAVGDYAGSERVASDWERQLAEAGVTYDETRRRWVQS